MSMIMWALVYVCGIVLGFSIGQHLKELDMADDLRRAQQWRQIAINKLTEAKDLANRSRELMEERFGSMEEYTNENRPQ